MLKRESAQTDRTHEWAKNLRPSLPRNSHGKLDLQIYRKQSVKQSSNSKIVSRPVLMGQRRLQSGLRPATVFDLAGRFRGVVGWTSCGIMFNLFHQGLL